ncbi:hypothetical protein V1522DRAFT_397695 [Lipomyces starkeyi]
MRALTLILRLVTLSPYCIFFHPVKSLHPAAGCLWALHPNAFASLLISGRIGRGTRRPFLSIVFFVLLGKMSVG